MFSHALPAFPGRALKYTSLSIVLAVVAAAAALDDKYAQQGG